MSNKRITDLTELTTPTTDDVFPVVDIASNTTQKVQLGNLPVPTAVTTALATKQDTLVSGTNIKTVNSTSLVGSGNVAVQPTLVSGTNIKTLNSVSLLGSGDIVLAATPSGVAGAIQFSNGSAFASDASNLFWDDTNNRLGVGTNAPASKFHVSSGSTGIMIDFGGSGNGNNYIDAGTSNTGFTYLRCRTETSAPLAVNFVNGYASAMLAVKGSGSTSATTSLLVQNSAGAAALTVKDDLSTSVKTLYIDNSIEGATSGRMNIISQYDLAIRPNAGGVGFAEGYGFSVNGSALIEMQSTTKGFLPPRMTTTQKNAIATPATGLVVMDITTNKLCCYNGSTWNDLF
jgi:hypothetical protein